jgi:hypothetical protein
MGKMSAIREFWEFLHENKKFFLMPIVAILMIVGLLLVATQGSAVAPFIYSLF